ncbi:MAG: PKD domain-containing protein [Crocinitomicaceae bacterium]|nr:PKD domain-containing protein [Crocinitomicaceae bacterium]
MKNLESKFKEALSNHEMDYNPQAWDAFKQRLDGQQAVQPNGGSKTLAKLGIAATVVGIMSVGAYFMFKGDGSHVEKSKDQKSTAEVIENPKQENHDFNNGQVSDQKIHNGQSAHQVDEMENHVEHEANLIDVNHVDLNKEIKKEEDKDPFDFDADPIVKNGNHVVDNKVDDKNLQPEEKLTLNASFSVNKLSGCEGLVCQFTPKQNDKYQGDFVWDFGDGTFSREKNPTHKYLKEGNYIVKLSLRSEINNEVISDQAQEYVTIYSNPKASFVIQENENNNAIPEFDFINTTNSGTEWIWDFGDNSTSTKKDPSHTYRKKGVYKVSLVAKNEYGCQSKVTKNITVENDYNLLAPTGFTPNGDGLNDNFIPKALEIMNVEFTMNIYHKNGQMYYKTNQVSRPWDGRYMMDNQNAPEGAYVWVVQLKNKNGETEVYRGSVTLLRD